MQQAPRTEPRQTTPESRLNLLLDRPAEVHFSFERPSSRLGVGASVVSHVVMALIVFAVIRYVPESVSAQLPPASRITNLIFVPSPGPGGGGGGGGNKMPEPPKKAEIPKPRPPAPTLPKPDPAPVEPPPPAPMDIPARTIIAEQPLAGVLESPAIGQTVAQGAGTGGGGGTGVGTGVGPGQGSGLGQGTGGGFGGGPRRPGSGVSMPRVLKEVKPQYTADAMRAKVQGTVLLECIVMPDGTVGETKVVRSLDSVFGLDQEALKAARQWKFVPGMFQGQAVPVIVTIELTFTLR